MLINSLLFLFLIIFSLIIFFINNIYIVTIILIISIILSLFFKVKLPLYIPFIILLSINFILNYFLSDINSALLVVERLFIMFILVNLIINKIGINNIGNIIGNIFRSKTLTLIISISLSFIPIMIKELIEIKKNLVSKNFPLSFKNILLRPNIFVITFFTNLFKKVNEMEKVFISRGVSE